MVRGNVCTGQHDRASCRGLLTQSLGWRSIFWINLPLGVAALVAAARLESRPGNGACRIDYAGIFSFVLATVALLLMLSLAGTAFAWFSGTTLGLCVTALGGYIGFGFAEGRATDPLISPRLFGNSIVWRTSLTVLLSATTLFGLVVELPLLFQGVLGTSVAMSGALLVPLTLEQVVVSTATGLLIARTGRPRNTMAFGLMIVALGCLSLGMSIGHGALVVCLLTVVVGAGLGSTMPVAQTIVQWAAGPSALGEATGEITLSRSVGSVFGAAIASSIVIGMLRTHAPDALPPGGTQDLIAAGSTLSVPLASAFRWLCIALSIVSGAAALVAWSLPDVNLSRPRSDGQSSPTNVAVRP